MAKYTLNRIDEIIQFYLLFETYVKLNLNNWFNPKSQLIIIILFRVRYIHSVY